MANIRFYAPGGVSDATLSDGTKIVVANGYATADTKYAPELMRAGWTPAFEDSSLLGGAGAVNSITYNANGTVNTYVKNGATYTVTYNANGFVSGISGTDGRSFTPSYDNNFRVTGVVVA